MCCWSCSGNQYALAHANHVEVHLNVVSEGHVKIIEFVQSVTLLCMTFLTVCVVDTVFKFKSSSQGPISLMGYLSLFLFSGYTIGYRRVRRCGKFE